MSTHVMDADKGGMGITKKSFHISLSFHHRIQNDISNERGQKLYSNRLSFCLAKEVYNKNIVKLRFDFNPFLLIIKEFTNQIKRYLQELCHM